MIKQQIYGSGMIAKSFLNVEIPDDIIVIAAGVSNSQENSISEFEREEKMLENIISNHANNKIVYFSSCSIYQSETTPYVTHKLKMEKLIKVKSSCYSIFRLPQVVGVSINNTLISFLINALLSKETIKVQEKAKRHLIDVEDVVRITKILILDKRYNNTITPICNGEKVSVSSIVKKIGALLSIEPVTDSIDIGESYDIPYLHLKGILSSNDIIFSACYGDKLLNKYVPLIAAHYKSNN